MQAQEMVEEVTALEQHLADAEHAGNMPALRRLVASDFSGVDARGNRVTRASFINQFAAPNAASEGLPPRTLSVRLFDHVAVVSGSTTLQEMTPGPRLSRQYQYTDIWALRVVQWELVSEHVSLIA